MKSKKKNKHYQNDDKKNKRRISILVNSQTLYHIDELCAMCGYSEKERGRIVDKLMRAYLAK